MIFGFVLLTTAAHLYLLCASLGEGSPPGVDAALDLLVRAYLAVASAWGLAILLSEGGAGVG